ncbi:MAG TPA: NADPH:quinone oxidoreductase family protein [Steroidobacteraceae bacterium]|nr:NADPH:quinone oxidoreductase family protein [Steroidobacteraceae bacterium]
MKALLCRQFGPPETLVVEELPDLVPGDGQVVIDVHAAGVNFPDSLIIEGKYQFKPPPPFSPGAECAGVVRAAGAGVKNTRVGDRVIAFTIYGAFASQVAADAARLVPMPPGLDFPTGAAFVMTYATSYHGLVDRGALQAGETLLVLGASGGVGLAAVEIGKALGARVIAAASSAAKLAICREHGADELIDYSNENLRERLKALTGGRGVDVVYDPVGGIYTEPALRSCAWRGRHLIVGFTNGEIPRIPANLALLKGCAIVGVFLGDYLHREPARAAADLRTLFEWLGAGKLRPHIAGTYPLARGGEAIRALVERRVSGKLVILPGE